MTWLPGHLRRSTILEGPRSEVPWVADLPASTVRERVRLILQPFDGPPDPATITRFMEHLGSDEPPLFSTDYPHWQFEGRAAIPARLDPALARRSRRTIRSGPYVAPRETVTLSLMPESLRGFGQRLSRNSRSPAAMCIRARRRRYRRREQGARSRIRRSAGREYIETIGAALSSALGEGIGRSEGRAAPPPGRMAERRESRQRSRLHGSAASDPNNVALVPSAIR